jgi:hypothetical protein
MARYYAHSKPFAALRKWFGIEKPYALQWGEWDEWRKNTKAAHPFGYWMTENLPSLLEKVPETFVDPFHTIAYRYRNRYHRQTHVLRTGLSVGDYHDLSERILYGLMNSFVDFVEVEKAWMQVTWSTNDEKFKLIDGRNREAGLAYLHWEATLDGEAIPPGERSVDQAINAREQLAIYQWWTEVRPNRPDPHEASGWNAFNANHKRNIDSIFDERVPRDEAYQTELRICLDKCHQIEGEYDDEDQTMLMRLIAIRKSLWT